MKQLNFYNVGIYCRLSKDDMLQGESSSILTQKTMLTQYVTERGWRIFDYYVDDGISGTTFEAVNATGVLNAVVDGGTHVSIKATNDAKMQEWIDSRTFALLNPHEYTLLLQGISIKIK